MNRTRASSRTTGFAVALICAGAYLPSMALALGCTTELELRTDQGGIAENAEITAVELPEGISLTTSPAGRIQKVRVELPSILYRRIQISATASEPAKQLAGSLAYYAIWPCNSTQKLTLHLAARSGSAGEVRQMWDDSRMASPPDSETAALYYGLALSTAEKRLERNPDGAHQYDLISTYLALRAFHIYAKLSGSYLAWNEKIQRIATWHIKLLSRVNKNGIEVIDKEGARLASERPSRTLLYRRLWREFTTTKNPEQALEGLDRFRRSLKEEADSDQILADLRLTHAEIVASTNSAASKVIRKASTSPDLLKLIDNNVRLSIKLADLSTIEYRNKLQSDANELSHRILTLRRKN